MPRPGDRFPPAGAARSSSAQVPRFRAAPSAGRGPTSRTSPTAARSQAESAARAFSVSHSEMAGMAGAFMRSLHTDDTDDDSGGIPPAYPGDPHRPLRCCSHDSHDSTVRITEARTPTVAQGSPPGEGRREGAKGRKQMSDIEGREPGSYRRLARGTTSIPNVSATGAHVSACRWVWTPPARAGSVRTASANPRFASRIT
jgi:hypothetical protein